MNTFKLTEKLLRDYVVQRISLFIDKQRLTIVLRFVLLKGKSMLTGSVKGTTESLFKFLMNFQTTRAR